MQNTDSSGRFKDLLKVLDEDGCRLASRWQVSRESRLAGTGDPGAQEQTG